MARTKKTRAALETENYILKRWRVSEGIISIFNNLIKWGSLVAIIYFFKEAIVALAGKDTSSKILFSFVSDLKMDRYAAYAAAIGGAIYGMRQRKLRKDTIERLQSRIVDLEKRLDPGRTTSTLTNRGETRPEDKA